MPAPPPKECVVCGRTITWRKKWERDWENVRYCSDRCRSRKAQVRDDPLEQLILDVLATRAREA
ncbi:MAG TPA: DUF2256 domain-containing protein, partial [Archangium sp.]|nr:DUF2256 domain-containing protein [Archangium sp.]